jgi:phasin family protein
MFFKNDCSKTGNELLEAQMAALQAATTVAAEGAGRAFELSLAVATASAQDAFAAGGDLLALRNPQALFSAACELAKSNADRAAAYGAQLTELRFSTRAQFLKISQEYLTLTQSKVKAALEV